MSFKTYTEKNMHSIATPNKGKYVKRIHNDKKEQIEFNEDEIKRNAFQRDKNRILYSKSFRRLIHKTQVCYAGVMNEHIRTRLTHTLEVSQIARSIAYHLNLNEDLAEAIALGHDLGHTPFGHRGEVCLQKIFSGEDKEINKEFFEGKDPETFINFKHNFQSVRVLTELEDGYPGFEGLNLTIPVLEGILKHTKIKTREDNLFNYEYISDNKDFFLDQSYSFSIEGQIVALADEIAQVSHDIEDAIEYNYDTKDVILGKLHSIVKQISIKGLDSNTTIDCNKDIKYVISCIISEIISTVLDKIELILSNNHYSYPLKYKIATEDTVLQDIELYKRLKEIEDTYIINNYTVDRMNDKSEFIIRQIIRAYLNNPKQLPDSTLEKYTLKCSIEKLNNAVHEIDSEPRNIRYIDSKLFNECQKQVVQDPYFLRLVCDHISSMTDTHAVEEFRKLYSEYVG